MSSGKTNTQYLAKLWQQFRRQKQEDLKEFKASQVYTASSTITGATERDLGGGEDKTETDSGFRAEDQKPKAACL